MTRYVIEALNSNIGQWRECMTVGNNIFKARAALFRCETRYPDMRFRIADTLADKPKPQLVWVNPMMAG